MLESVVMELASRTKHSTRISHKFLTLGLSSLSFSAFTQAMCPMLVKINGQPQVSFEQFRETFRETFGRDLTPDERGWFEPANFLEKGFEIIRVTG